MERIQKILTHLGLGDGAQKIYLSLLRDGKATPRLLAQRTGVTRPSVYDHLKVLMARDLIVELDIEGKATFALGDINRLDAALREEIEVIEEGRKLFKETLPTLLASLDHVQPRVRFFEGKEGVMQLMKDILWHEKVTLHIVWPYYEMLEVLGADFLTWFNERREVRKISVQSIWPHALKAERRHLFTTDGDDVERRFAKKDQIAHMGYLIYKNKVAFVSSRAEGFGFIVESTEFADLMRMQFTNLWQSLPAAKKS
jgi:HTH-type transcriptional regulator, sugar sensing transcriptional regulator